MKIDNNDIALDNIVKGKNLAEERNEVEWVENAEQYLKDLVD